MKRATVYFDEELHTAIKLKAVETGVSLSELVNISVKESLSEDLDDLNSFEERRNEKSISFESFVKELKRSGKL